MTDHGWHHDEIATGDDFAIISAKTSPLVSSIAIPPTLSLEQAKIFESTIAYLEETARLDFAAGMAIARRDAASKSEIAERHIAELQGQIAELQGQIAELQGQIAELQGQIAGLLNAYFANMRRNGRRRDFMRRLLVLSPVKKWLDRKRLRQQRRLIAKSGLFDEALYLRSHPEIAAEGLDPIVHYLEAGASQGFDPRDDFHTTAFCAENTKASLKGVNPFIFYIDELQRNSRG